MTTKKREYEKPSMQVFELKRQPQLLVGSMQDYDWDDVPEVE
jgi:hypothetical protein